ncbi:MAG: TonB-dependent receptor [Gammaproteobacteria bacterium]|nr:TonB-dependent receptor [Gammaproteobacteria bacterium]
MKYLGPLCVPLAALILVSGVVRAGESGLQEVVITALRDTRVSVVPASVTVLDPAALQAAGVQHFADVLALVPGLGAAGGTSRPRYYQLRGVGEFEQYQGAPDPSVGFLIDGIDFSGVGMPATLFDVERVEVVRGPQATSYGANALGGLIALRTRAPGEGFDLRAEATGGDYDTVSGGLALGAGTAQGGWRIAAQQYRSDGFRRNAWLHRDDTNGYDEGTLRGKLRWQGAGGLRLDATLMHVDLDNGYDAWSIDNSRVTRTDRPGRDAQRSDGAALQLCLPTAAGELRSLTSAARSRIHYAFDGDWGNDALWGDAARWGADYSPYDYYERIIRRRRTLAEDLRFIGDAARPLPGGVRWLAGVHALRLAEDDEQLDGYMDVTAGWQTASFQSRYRAVSTALYGQFDRDAGERGTLSLGLRLERRDARYADSLGTPLRASDTLGGGNLSWSWRASPRQRWYVTLARGYKAGGFNIGSAVPAGRREFRPESLWNLELGLRRGGGTAFPYTWQAALFYMRRAAQQVDTSVQSDPGNPLLYVFFKDNARGEHFGAEQELSVGLGPHWRLESSLALLRARYRDYTYGARDLDGRQQAFVPGYRASAALAWSAPAGWYARIDAEAVDTLYFSAADDTRARAYQLVHLRVGLARGPWNASLWVRNLFDRDYAVHGFYFGLEPPDFAPRQYLQAGDPRQLGVTLRYHLASRGD